MSTLRAVNQPGWSKPKGCSIGVAGRGMLVFATGQAGWSAEERFESDDRAARLRQALADTVAAGADKQDYMARIAAIGAAYREVMGRSFPAMTLVGTEIAYRDRVHRRHSCRHS